MSDVRFGGGSDAVDSVTAAPVCASALLAERAADLLPGLGGTTRLVCIDGPAGSGKTTLAAKLAALLPSQVIHMDDLYEGWTGIDAGIARLHDWVLRPIAAGNAGRYRRYDWHTESYAERHSVPIADFLVVEGCGSAGPGVDAYAPLIIWVEADDDVRLARGLRRDGDQMAAHWLHFMADERAMYERDLTRERSHVWLDGDGQLVK